LLGIRPGVWVRRPIGVPFQGDGRHGDDRSLGQPLFQCVVWRLACCQTQAPAIVMHPDADMIRMVEGRRGTLERGRIDGPLRRGGPPDAAGEVAAVLLVAHLSARGGDITWVPPCELGLGRQRHLSDSAFPCAYCQVRQGCRSGSELCRPYMTLLNK